MRSTTLVWRSMEGHNSQISRYTLIVCTINWQEPVECSLTVVYLSFVLLNINHWWRFRHRQYPPPTGNQLSLSLALPTWALRRACHLYNAMFCRSSTQFLATIRCIQLLCMVDSVIVLRTPQALPSFVPIRRLR